MAVNAMQSARTIICPHSTAAIWHEGTQKLSGTVSLCADGSREAIDQLVSDCLRPGDRRRSDIRKLM